MHIPTFSKAFYQTPPDRPTSPTRPPQEQPPVLFSDSRHAGQTMQQFMESPDFTQCKQEYAELIDGMINFVENQADKLVPPLSTIAVDAILGNFQELKEHLTNTEMDFFSAHKPLVYGAGKEMFHALADLLEDDGMPLQKRLVVLQVMAPQMAMCSGGVFTALQHGISSLKFNRAGITGAAYLAKVNIAENLISEHVKASHLYHTGNEIHFVNAYFNFLADDIGLKQRSDSFIPIGESEISAAQFDACRLKVLTKLKPSALATVMADDYLGRIKSAVANNRMDVNASLKGAQLTAAFGLTENLQKNSLNSEFGEVPLESILVPISNTDEHEYQLVSHAMPLARHFMQELKRTELLNYDDVILLAKGPEGSGDLMQLGDLFWLDKEGKSDELKAHHLLAVPAQEIINSVEKLGIDAQENGTILELIVAQVLDAALAGDIEDIPEDWLSPFARLLAQPGEPWETAFVLRAAELNRTSALAALIKAGANVDNKNARGETAAMFAARHSHIEALQALISAGADINVTESQGFTGAMLAAGRGHTEALQAFIAAEANINIKNAEGNTAAMFAARYGRTEALTALIVAGADIDDENVKGETAAMFAAGTGHTEALLVLIDAGANIDLNSRDAFTAAMFAALTGHTEALKALIDARADINVTGPKGFTAALIAAQNGRAEVLKALITARADMNVTGPQGFNAVMIAAQNGHTEALKVLITAGMDVNIKNANGDTAAIIATLKGHVEALKALIAAEADVNAINAWGWNATMFAADCGSTEALKILIAAGADINVKNSRHQTAAMIATANGHTEAVQVLIAAEANINV